MNRGTEAIQDKLVADIRRWENTLRNLDPNIEGEEYEGKRDGCLAQLEHLSDELYCIQHDC